MGVQVPPFAPVQDDERPWPLPGDKKRGRLSQPIKPAGEPSLKLVRHESYREGYANSVQVRMSVWDFFLGFGTLSQSAPEEVTLESFQGVYLSPQQAKALCNLLQGNLKQYEETFGAISIEPVPAVGGPVN